jgi:hypothetical protein
MSTTYVSTATSAITTAVTMFPGLNNVSSLSSCEAGKPGIEPGTSRLTAGRSTVELLARAARSPPCRAVIRAYVDSPARGQPAAFTTNLELGAKDSNLDCRVQSPVSCPLDEPPVSEAPRHRPPKQGASLSKPYRVALLCQIRFGPAPATDEFGVVCMLRGFGQSPASRDTRAWSVYRPSPLPAPVTSPRPSLRRGVLAALALTRLAPTLGCENARRWWGSSGWVLIYARAYVCAHAPGSSLCSSP